MLPYQFYSKLRFKKEDYFSNNYYYFLNALMTPSTYSFIGGKNFNKTTIIAIAVTVGGGCLSLILIGVIFFKRMKSQHRRYVSPADDEYYSIAK